MEQDMQKNQMDSIYNITRDIVRNWWVVLCIALSAAFLANMASVVTYHPKYTSSTTFVVSSKSSSEAYANASKTENLTGTFQSVLDSQILKKKVAESLGMESFPGQVQVAVVPETNLLTLSVTSDSPDMAFRLLQGILEYYPQVSEKVLGEVVLDIFEEPVFPSRPDNGDNSRENMKKAFLAAAMAMILILGVMSYQKDGVKSEAEVEQKLDTILFGTLEHEPAYRNLKAYLKRQKKKILITEPAVGFGYRESVKKIRTKLMYKDDGSKCKVLLVTSTGRHEGKTTVAVNLALSMAQRGRNVLLIEGDLRSTGMAALLDVEQAKGPGTGKEWSAVEYMEERIIQMEGSTMNLLVNHTVQRRSTEILASGMFRDFLESMKQKMDVIIIDGPSVKGRADAEVLARQADMSLLVVKQNYSRVPYINDTLDMLNRYGGVLGCVFNDVYSSDGILSSGYGYGYGYGRYRYGYGGYGRYGKYGYGKYGKFGKYGRYGQYGIWDQAAQDQAASEQTVQEQAIQDQAIQDQQLIDKQEGE